MKKIHLKMKVLEWSQRFSHYKSMGIVPNDQGQLTHKSFAGYCPISNPSKILWLSSLPARIKKNQSKMKELEWSQGFPHYNPMGAICCHGNQSSDPIWPKTLCSQSPPPWCSRWYLITIGQLVSEIWREGWLLCFDCVLVVGGGGGGGGCLCSVLQPLSTIG